MLTIDPSKTALIIFVRHPELGKVKTRLAKVIGDEKALQVYELLLEHTQHVTQFLKCQKFVYYTSSLPEHDTWSNLDYNKRQQVGDDLGERMRNAFTDLFEQGFEKVLIIGSDCYQLQTIILNEAIALLDKNDVVIGPTFDGGYYLLGMNNLVTELFVDKAWSTEKVCTQTIKSLNNLSKSFILLEQLHDVDEAIDLEVNCIKI